MNSATSSTINKALASLKRQKYFNPSMLTFVVLFAVVGAIFVISSHAATPYASTTADSGTLTAPAVKQTCSGASDGTCVLFGNSGGSGAKPVNSIGPYFTASTGTTSSCSNGCSIVGQTLGVNSGTWSNSPISYGYQWDRCTTTSAQPPTTASCSAISGATSSTYTVTSADSGHSLVPIVTAYNGSTASTPTTISGSCKTGEIVATGESSSPEPTNPISGCSPVSAVVGNSQTTERFCTNAVTTCGYADPMNGTAGVPSGTNLSTTGSCSDSSISAASSTTGGIINGCEINSGLDITANNVTVENSDIVSDNSTGPIITDENNTGTKFLNDSIHGTTPSGSATAAWAIEGDNITENHVYVYNVDRILMMYPNDGSSTVTNSFCWINGEAGDEHHECIYNGGGANLTASNDVLLNLQTETAAIFYDNPDYGGSGTTGTLNASGDIFSGGTYTIYGGEGNAGTDHTGAESFTNNRWSRIIYTTGGQFGSAAYLPSNAVWSGNQWDDTNEAL